MSSITAKNLDEPDASRFFLDKSRRDVIKLSSVIIGRGMYGPGWRWSEHGAPTYAKHAAERLM